MNLGPVQDSRASAQLVLPFDNGQVNCFVYGTLDEAELEMLEQYLVVFQRVLRKRCLTPLHRPVDHG